MDETAYRILVRTRDSHSTSKNTAYRDDSAIKSSYRYSTGKKPLIET